jgi:predicted nucleic acid-binding protein
LQSFVYRLMCIVQFRRGFVILPVSKRRAQLERWFEVDLLPRFQGRILPITHSVADRWGELDGRCQQTGTSLSTADGMIAAMALEHGMTVVTRNAKHFAGLDIAVFNSWEIPIKSE